ncbi:hypothetical protein [Streptomyces sp. enrichment culture]|uniref:hypothetical protein n=1 Tax=Streptomyces sp. enrichment culture TaxID=1795815 RepID=UPI003F5571CC
MITNRTGASDRLINPSRRHAPGDAIRDGRAAIADKTGGGYLVIGPNTADIDTAQWRAAAPRAGCRRSRLLLLPGVSRSLLVPLEAALGFVS